MTYQKSKRLINFKFIQISLIILILLLFPRLTTASELNNKLGIHLAQPQFEDLDSAAKLINSTGGDWGYVTLVVQEDDRKKDKWQAVFDQLRKLRLIPIIRLATKPEGPIWRRPNKEEAADWANFLDSLNWVVKERYVILFNEPNHGAEWGGAVDAKSYAEVAVEFAEKLKEKNPDFFVMLAGLDASAPSSFPNYEDEGSFLRAVFNYLTVEQFNNLISGWSSHSYPNPDFSGSPDAVGRGTINTYQWELGLLSELGINKEPPVFITETGWRRGSESLVASNFAAAYENVWLPDDRVKAVTPFILNYQGEPFLAFSWQKFESSNFYQQYYTVQALSKIKGKPVQIEKGAINFDLPKNLVAQSSYQFNIKLKNLGQGFWDKDANYQLSVINNQQKIARWLFSDIKDLKPFEEKQLPFYINTSNQLGKQRVRYALQKGEDILLESGDWLVEIKPLPSLSFKVSLFPKINDQGKDFEVQIFDKNKNLVFVKRNQEVFGSKGVVDNIKNIVLGDEYRVVILKPYYLPRQDYIIFRENNNQIRFKPMAPIDFDRDGKLSFNDLTTLFKQPKLLKLLIP